MLVHASFPNADDEDDYKRYSIDVIETVPSETQLQEPKSKPNVRRLGTIFMFVEDEPEDVENYSEPSLRLDLESLEVLDIKSVTYDSDHRTVSRRRHTKSIQDVTATPF